MGHTQHSTQARPQSWVGVATPCCAHAALARAAHRQPPRGGEGERQGGALPRRAHEAKQFCLGLYEPECERSRGGGDGEEEGRKCQVAEGQVAHREHSPPPPARTLTPPAHPPAHPPTHLPTCMYSTARSRRSMGLSSPLSTTSRSHAAIARLHGWCWGGGRVGGWVWGEGRLERHACAHARTHTPPVHTHTRISPPHPRRPPPHRTSPAPGEVQMPRSRRWRAVRAMACMAALLSPSRNTLAAPLGCGGGWGELGGWCWEWMGGWVHVQTSARAPVRVAAQSHLNPPPPLRRCWRPGGRAGARTHASHVHRQTPPPSAPEPPPAAGIPGVGPVGSLQEAQGLHQRL